MRPIWMAGCLLGGIVCVALMFGFPRKSETAAPPRLPDAPSAQTQVAAVPQFLDTAASTEPFEVEPPASQPSFNEGVTGIVFRIDKEHQRFGLVFDMPGPDGTRYPQVLTIVWSEKSRFVRQGQTSSLDEVVQANHVLFVQNNPAEIRWDGETAEPDLMTPKPPEPGTRLTCRVNVQSVAGDGTFFSGQMRTFGQRAPLRFTVTHATKFVSKGARSTLESVLVPGNVVDVNYTVGKNNLATQVTEVILPHPKIDLLP